MALLIMRLEVNWPYTERNLSLEEAVRSIALCLESSESGLGYVLKKDYVYWHQVLGEIYLHRNFCFLVVWTTKDVAIVKIEKDEAWAANIPRSTQSHWNNLFEINCAMPQIWSECCFKLHFFYLYFYNKSLLGNPCGQLLSGIVLTRFSYVERGNSLT